MPENQALVLVIDDSEENLEIISAKLTHRGFRVLTATDGESGLEKAAAGPPDVILLDIMLPKMDGWTVMSRLKQNERTRDVPVILMTAYTTIQFHGERDLAIRNGAADYLKKPFDLGDMTDLVEKYAQRREFSKG